MNLIRYVCRVLVEKIVKSDDLDISIGGKLILRVLSHGDHTLRKSSYIPNHTLFFWRVEHESCFSGPLQNGETGGAVDRKRVALWS